MSHDGVNINVLMACGYDAVVIVRFESRSSRSKSRKSDVGMNAGSVMDVVMVMQPALGGRGTQFPMPWYLFTARAVYPQAVLRG